MRSVAPETLMVQSTWVKQEMETKMVIICVSLKIITWSLLRVKLYLGPTVKRLTFQK